MSDDSSSSSTSDSNSVSESDISFSMSSSSSPASSSTTSSSSGSDSTTASSSSSTDSSDTFSKSSTATVSNGDESDEKERYQVLWYCYIVTQYPKSAFGITLGVHFLMVAISFALLSSGYDLIPATFHRLPLDIRDDVDYLRGLAWQERMLGSDYILDRHELSNANQSQRSVLGEQMHLYFEEPGGNVFTARNLQSMRDTEDKFYENKEFQANFCQLDKNGQCMKANSVLRYFDGTYEALGDVYRPDHNFERIVEILHETETNDMTKKYLQVFLGREACINDSLAESDITRSFLPVGKPLRGFLNETDREDQQASMMENFLLNHFKPLADEYFRNGAGDMDFFYYSPTLLDAAIQASVVKDLTLAAASMTFIVVFICIQTGSLWISGFALCSIFCSFVTTNLLYRVVLDYRYFGSFHVLAVFIILGIGADDVFIMFDTWKESAHHKYFSLAHRMSYVYRKASIAMLFTSLTTALAFIVSGFSPFLGVFTFGVFSGILVCVNFLSVIFFFPTVIIIYHNSYEKYCCCCFHPRHDGLSSNNNSNNTAMTAYEPKTNFVVRFLRGPYHDLVTHSFIRWLILAAFAGLMFFFVSHALKLEVNEEQVKFLKDESNFGKYLMKKDAAFRSVNVDSSTRVLLVWGMREQDLSCCHPTDPDCFGYNVWDDSFNLNTAAAQEALLNLCHELRTLDNLTVSQLTIRRDLVTDALEVQCFMEELDEYLKGIPDVDIPVEQTDAVSVMSSNSRVYNSAGMKSGFFRYFEIVMSYWLYDGLDVINGQPMGGQFSEYDYFLGESLDAPHTQSKKLTKDYKYYYGTKLSYAAISINTTLQMTALGYPRGLEIRNAWEKFFTDKLKGMPEELQDGFQISLSGTVNFNLWHWLKVQKQLVYSAMSGIVISICFTLPILIIATMNVVIGLLATIIIVCITISVIGIIPLGGWKLGVLECLNLVLVVGLSVDYVVHLAEGYSRSTHTDRWNRTRDALNEVGISVLSGALTSLGASLFLLFAQILFFTEFGIFMFGTIGFSILYSLGLFITVMGTIGPQGNFGSLMPLYTKLCGSRSAK